MRPASAAGGTIPSRSQGESATTATARSAVCGIVRPDHRRAARCGERGGRGAKARDARGDSYMFSLQLRDTLPQRDQCALGFFDGAHALRRDLEKSLRAPATLRRRFADRRGDEPVALEPIEGRVNGSDDNAPAASALDFRGNGDTVSRVADP